MLDQNLKGLDESIDLLSGYRDRLRQEVITIAKKLQMPSSKINSTLEENQELNEIKKVLSQLIAHREKQLNQENVNS